jgi:sugar/nucleoside kinase (ribokinase family)
MATLVFDPFNGGVMVEVNGATIDVLGIGNAIVDVVSHADDELVTELGLAKGAMTLIDTEQAEAIYRRLGPGVEVSGGSCANTIAGLASLGATTAFIGRVRDDQLGQIFAHDIRSIGVTFNSAPAASGPPTARCLILVTPDAQRTMCTYLGASVDFGVDDLEPDLIARSGVTYLEGYLWDPPSARDAFRRAMSDARAEGRAVALTLSDPFVVDRHRAELRAELESGRIDILFANDAEIRSLYETDDFDAASAQVAELGLVAALTRGASGSRVQRGSEVADVPAERIGEVVDTTGAGDLYAAGVLYGISEGFDLETCGRLGSIAAAEAISHIGPRPEVDLKELVAPLLVGMGR